MPPIVVKEKTDFAPQPQEAPSVKKTPKILKLSDLKSSQKNVETITGESKDEQPESHTNTLAFTEDNLKKVWVDIAESFKEKKPGVTNVMNLYFPQIDQNAIKVVVESDTQKNILSEQWEAIVRIIRERFNENIEMQLIFEANNDSGKKKLFGPHEKMKRLIELNPAIAKLSKELGLDFDY